MANYPQELAQNAVCQSHTGHMTGLWFLPTRLLRLNTNEWMLFRSILRTEDTPPTVVIGVQVVFVTARKQSFPFPECWKISMSENSRSFMFKNTRLGHWHLLHRCYLGVLGLIWYYPTDTRCTKPAHRHSNNFPPSPTKAVPKRNKPPRLPHRTFYHHP